MPACALFVSDIHHTRHGQPSHFLARRGLSIWLDLDQLVKASTQSRLFSIGAFNLLSFYERDYGPNFGHKRPLVGLADYVRQIAGKILPNTHVARVQLLTFPRILGVAFNPLSVYVAQNDQGDDVLYIYEVRNTFGDMHAYVGAPTGKSCCLQAQKIFHVSPFFPVAGEYRLLMRHDRTRMRLVMRYMIGAKAALTATMRGKLIELDSAAILKCLWQTGQWPLRPWVSIHSEAVKLWIKKIQFYKRPDPPKSAWSRAHNMHHGL